MVVKKIIYPKIGKIIDDTITFLVEEYSRSGHNPKPVILHSVSVAFCLMEYGYGLKLIQAAILHDLVEDSNVTIRKIRTRWGSEVAELVDSLIFKASIKKKEEQCKELFARTKKAGKRSLIIKCADIYINSFYINLVKNKNKEIFLFKKLKYFLQISKPLIGKEPIWKELNKRAIEEKRRIATKYKTKL